MEVNSLIPHSQFIPSVPHTPLLSFSSPLHTSTVLSPLPSMGMFQNTTHPTPMGHTASLHLPQNPPLNYTHSPFTGQSTPLNSFYTPPIVTHIPFPNPQMVIPPYHSQNPQQCPPTQSQMYTVVQPSPTSHHTPTFNPNPKLEFPKFDGRDPKGWIIRAEQYFDFISIDEQRRVKLAGMHFEGKAGIWFRYYQASRGTINWRGFVNDVVARFENPEGRDVLDLFSKLRQEGSVEAYEDKFEELRALIVAKYKGFTEEYFVSSFISGLKEHIKTSVRMFRPQTLGDAVFLAKQEEVKGSRGMISQAAKTNFGKAPSYTYNDSKGNSSHKPSDVSNSKDFKKGRSVLSSKEILERRERGQCFHCDEKYHPGQNCKARLYMLSGEQMEGEDYDGVDREFYDMENMDTPGEISLNALAGTKSMGTIRLQGCIRGKKVSILVDSGSTHSFIDSTMVKTLGLTAEIVAPLMVTVADGTKVLVDSSCNNVSYEIQGHKFSTELRLFPLSNSDVILGVDWLRQHNPVTFDYHRVTVKFQR